MNKQEQSPQPRHGVPTPDAAEQRSGEGAASALARLRMQERTKAREQLGQRRPALF